MRTQRIDLTNGDIELRYANWLKIAIDLISPKNLYLIGGRGLGKTSDIMAERSQEIIWDMPGAPLAFVGDTYMNLQKNIVRTFLEGWERKGWRENIHYVVDQRPPGNFDPSYNKLLTYQHTLSVFNGCNFTLVSMDRPSTGAGSSYMHLFGDEAKYLKEEKLKKLTPAIRGDYIRFGNSIYYRGRTFTTDYPDGNNIHEDGWILRMVKNMDRKQITQILDCAFILNDIRIQIYNAEKKGSPNLHNIRRNLERWDERYRKIRHNSTLFYIASSFVNADILTEGYFLEQFEDMLFGDYKTSICSIKPSLEKGQLFYGNLNEKHFYSDGYNYDYYDKFGLKDDIVDDSRGLRYVRPHEKLEAGVDFGNMISLVIGQLHQHEYRILRDFYVITPLWIRELADQFLEYFLHHKHRELDLYYDRSANAYNKQKEDFASKLKAAIEKKDGKSTGWRVNLMSLAQGNILHGEEFDLMNELMGEKNDLLPRLLIDQYQCKELKSSLELAPVSKDSRGNIVKVKTSEKLPAHRLPMESTNMSDAFKYLLCRKRYLDLVKSRRSITFSDPIIRSHQ